MEALMAHDELEVPRRLLKLIRIYISFLASCPFCIDMNADEYRESGLSEGERAIVVIASTCAQVNFWTRLIQSSGVQPAGFSKECSILELDKYKTLRRPE
jgi:hypothetical protein